MLASDTKQVEKAEVLQCPTSDHNLVYVTLWLKKPCNKPVFITPTVVKKIIGPKNFTRIYLWPPWSFADAFSNVDDKLYALFFIQRYSNEHALIKAFKACGKLNPCVNDNNSWRRQGIAGVKGQRKPMSLWRGLPTGTLGVKLNIKLDFLRTNS